MPIFRFKLKSAVAPSHLNLVSSVALLDLVL
jgi:hypothetical protein